MNLHRDFVLAPIKHKRAAGSGTCLFVTPSREIKEQTAHEESFIKGFSDMGSIPIISTNNRPAMGRFFYRLLERGGVDGGVS